MKRREFIALCAAAPLYSSNSDFRPLFNGRNLNGWKPDVDGVWSVRDGMIVGKTSGLKFNDFLWAEGTYTNFILKASFRLVGNAGNSGIQFRSKHIPNSHEAFGYQADIGETHWGSLYDESRRRVTLVQPTEKLLAPIDMTGWNTYVIDADGNHITLDLSGIRTVDYTEKDPHIEQSGSIALQVHMNHNMEVQFKDISIKEL